MSRVLWATAWLLLALGPLRERLEASMLLHMLVQLPLLLLAGYALAARWPPLRWDAEGLSGAVVLVAVPAFWMIPSALDLSLLEPLAAAAKVASWIGAGIALRLSPPRWRREVAAFVLGNLAWMMLTVGLLYREAESRLCVNYRFDQQVWAGNGLFVLGLVLAALTLWCLREAGAARQNAEDQNAGCAAPTLNTDTTC